MQAQQASKLIGNANIDLTIRKPSEFKPRKGYKLVHMKYSSDLTPTADSTHRILGRGYFWTEKGIKELCYVIEVPVNEAVSLNRMFENEKAEYRRAHRCKIWNKKRTKKIMCPFTNTCSKCPIPPEERFPSEAEEHQELSYDEINEEKLSLPPDAFGSAENMDLRLEMQQMLKAIKDLKDQLFYNFAVLFSQGYEYEDVMEELGIDRDGIKTCYAKYIYYKKEYLD